MQRSQRLKKARALKGQLEQLRDGLESDAPEIDYIDDAVNSLDDAIFELSEFDDDGVDDAAYGYA
jgi:phage antirepressor YoqD-like protein